MPFFPKHLHLADTDADGGTYYAIRKANSQMLLAAIMADRYNNFYSEVSGTGAAVGDNTQTGYSNILIGSGSTNGGYASGFISSVKIDFSKPALFVTKLNETYGTSILTRIGVGIEKVQNTTDNTQKFGIEGCDANGPNFQLLAADGVGRSMVDGLTAIATSVKCLKFTYTPGSSVVLQAAYGGTTATITTNCPSSGSLTNENQLLRFGVKGTTTTARSINLYAALLYGTAVNSDWF